MAEVNRYMGPIDAQDYLSTEDTARRLHAMVHTGLVTSINYEACTAMATIGNTEFGPFKWVEKWTHGDISWHAPAVGQQVLILCRSGRMENGFILGGIYEADTKPALEDGNIHRIVYEDGTVVAYNKETKKLHANLIEGGQFEVKIDDEPSMSLTASSFVINAGGKQLTLNSSGLHVDGNIEDTNGTMQEMRSTYNSHTHSESVGTTTAAPSQQMN